MATEEWYSGITKDLRVGSVLTYTLRWGAWLATGVSIASYTVAADAGITVIGSANDNTSVTFQVAGISLGQTKKVLVTIVTDEAEPQTDARAITFLGIAAAT